MIDDFLADNDFFGARQLILSSASSKTAYGTAFCAAQRRGSARAIEVAGLTSPGNLAFTGGLGCYDRVLAYDELAGLPASTPTVYVDFSGNAALRTAVVEAPPIRPFAAALEAKVMRGAYGLMSQKSPLNDWLSSTPAFQFFIPPSALNGGRTPAVSTESAGVMV